jgi:hypothetical protein
MVAATLNKYPEADLIYSDEDKIDENGPRFGPHFKSDWNPDLMLSQNMFCHLGIYRRSLMEKIGGFRCGYEGSQDYDLVLRAQPLTTPNHIRHIPPHSVSLAGNCRLGSVSFRGEDLCCAKGSPGNRLITWRNLDVPPRSCRLHARCSTGFAMHFHNRHRE